MISVALNASNREDWTIQFSVEDEATGNAIDFSGADVSFKVRDSYCCQEAVASTDAGTITQPIVGTLQIVIPYTTMKTLCKGTYLIGCIYQLNGATAQLFSGTVDIYDGIASI